ncbi:B-cell receptor CD22 [Phaethornis superciliosus]
MPQIQVPPGATRGHCHLPLPRVQAGDGGVYGLRLVAQDRGGRELLWMHRVTVNVTDTPPEPHIWPDPSPLTEGSIVTFGCWVPPPCTPLTLTWEGPPTSTLGVQVGNWTPPPSTLTPPYWVLGTQVTFRTSWNHDGTHLRCLLRGAGGATLTQASRLLHVNYAPLNLSVEVKPRSPVLEGEEVTLSCHNSAKPPSYTYVWSLGGEVLPHRGAQVHLQNIRAKDGGTYHCKATNMVGTRESPPASLEVHYAPRDLRVEVTPAPPVWEGQEVTLRCHHRAQPPPHALGWTLGGRELPQSRDRVLLSPAQATHGGNYSCWATNTLGTATSQPLDLKVYYAPRAAILKNLTSLPALAGDPVTLTCDLGPAYPPPLTVQWLRNSRLITSTAGHALTFMADPARAGTYHCGGRNVVGSAFSSPLEVVVWYPPISTRILQFPPGPAVVGGGPVGLRCQVGGSQPPKWEVTWLKDGEEFPHPPTAPPGPQNSTPDPRDLLFLHPQPIHRGLYVCRARNRAGVTPSPPHFLAIHSEEGDDVTLRCHAQAQPLPHTFEWFRDGEILGRTPRNFWVLEKVGTRASGRYRCRVINDVTAADSSDVIVTVYYSAPQLLLRTLLGVTGGLSPILALGALGCFLRRRETGDSVVYSVLKRDNGTTKAPEGPDYENVPSGGSSGDGDREGTLLYVTLALSPPVTSPRGDLGDSVEYATLRP